MTTLLFYKKPVAINKAAHEKIKVAPRGDDYSFAANTNSVIVAGVEFAEIAKEYPIVFVNTGNDVTMPVTMLGLRNEENLFLDEDNSWKGRYVPAFVRRYPFVLAETGTEDNLTVCIDEAYKGYDAEEGVLLFDEAGEPSAELKSEMDFLTEYQRQFQRTTTFVERIKEADLLMDLSARVDMKDGRQFALSGLQVIDEKKLLQLDDEKVIEIFRAGEMAWIYSHLLSLSNIGRLVDMIPADS